MNNLKLFFKKIKLSKHNGIEGVLCLQGKKPGPVVGITACTHGNEPSGLATLQYLIEKFGLEKKILRGTVYLVVNNIKATERYFRSKTVTGKERARFIDINMNRIPQDTLERKGDGRYEILRAQALTQIIKKFEVGLDIHSTIQDSDPMIIVCGNSFYNDLIYGFPIKTAISNIDVIQTGKPISSFYGHGKKHTKILAIESGSHENKKSFQTAVDCTTALLQNLKMIPGKPKSHKFNRVKYTIKDSIFFPNNSYRLVRKFNDFEFISKGSVIAKGDTSPIVAPFDAYLIFCPKGTKPVSIAEEVMFLATTSKK